LIAELMGEKSQVFAGDPVAGASFLEGFDSSPRCDATSPREIE